MAIPLHSAKLVHCTDDAEKLVAYCARVSNPANQDNDNIAGLLRHCAKHGHWSIFEMASMCVEIYTTRAISPQILRHGKGFSFQEFSQRYASVELLPELNELPELRRQDTKNRQNSIDDLPTYLVDSFNFQVAQLMAESDQLYHRMLAAGVAKECARNVLTLGGAPTKLYMHGTLRSWIHYIALRSGNGTQKEHRLIAESIGDIFEKQFPIIYEATLIKSE